MAPRRPTHNERIEINFALTGTVISQAVDDLLIAVFDTDKGPVAIASTRNGRQCWTISPSKTRHKGLWVARTTSVPSARSTDEIPVSSSEQH